MKPETVELTEDHVRLLRSAYIEWNDCEFGAPAINCKRPYGNSDVLSDIRRILGHDFFPCPHCGERIPKENAPSEEVLLALHRSMEVVLQVVLSAGSFKPGFYVKVGYNEWAREVR